MVVEAPVPPLTNEEAKIAVQTLVDDELTLQFPRVERSRTDPPIPGQNIVNISFYPAKNATPDENQIYGWMKIRGAFPTKEAATAHADLLIRTVDSFALIRQAYVGYPFPCTNERKFTKDVHEINVNMSTAISEDVKQKMQSEIEQRNELKERERQIRERAEMPEEPLDTYTTLHVTKSKALMNKEMAEKVLEETRVKIRAMDREYPEFQKLYMDRFNSAKQETKN